VGKGDGKGNVRRTLAGYGEAEGQSDLEKVRKREVETD
jgi:hypothetical protein